MGSDATSEDRPRAAGIELGSGGWRPGITEPRVLGLPVSHFGFLQPADRPKLPHPLRWLRWRRRVAREGPYAPDFDPSAPD
jgi:hypothetical protein